jgi:hypothetical protein
MKTKEEIKTSDLVSWEHIDSRNGKVFTAKGYVHKIRKTCTGGTRNEVEVAKIFVCPHPYWKIIGRKSTTISLKKLTRIIED